jgi:hypothetical protein
VPGKSFSSPFDVKIMKKMIHVKEYHGMPSIYKLRCLTEALLGNYLPKPIAPVERSTTVPAPVDYGGQEYEDNLVNPQTGQPETAEQRADRLRQAEPVYGVPTTENPPNQPTDEEDR